MKFIDTYKHPNEVTVDNDIKFRGIFSYRIMRILGWVAMAVAQIATILGIAYVSIKLPDGYYNEFYYNAAIVCTYIGTLSFPLFLVANFGIILNSRRNVKKLIITQAIFVVAFYLVFLLLYARYLYGILSTLLKWDAATIDSVMSNFMTFFTQFNVFVDLLMCSLTYFFLTYKPSKIFVGKKKLIIFRLFVLFPILFEIAVTLIKGFGMGLNMFAISPYLVPIITSKPTVTYLAFLVICLLLILKKKRFIKQGGTEEGYHAFQETNAYCLHVSLIVIVVFLFAALFDHIAEMMFYNYYFSPTYAELFETDYDKYVKLYEKQSTGWGLGKGVTLAMVTPFVFFFCINRTHDPKTKVFDTVLPIAGVILCVLVYLEGFYQIMLKAV